MKKRQTSSNQASVSSASVSPSPDTHKENIPFGCSKSETSEDIPDDPQPSTIWQADEREKLQIARLQDRKTRNRYSAPSQCPCCGRITR